jgi:hypothetical protein
MGVSLVFVVRVYRRANGVLKGMVEDVQGRSRTPFSGPEELWSVIARGSTGGDEPGLPDKRDDSPD